MKKIPLIGAEPGLERARIMTLRVLEALDDDTMEALDELEKSISAMYREDAPSVASSWLGMSAMIWRIREFRKCGKKLTDHMRRKR